MTACPECRQDQPEDMRWCGACAAPLKLTDRTARTRARCRCGAWAEWIELEEDPQVEPPGPYATQVCAPCGASLSSAWLELHRRILARTTADARGAFPLVMASALIVALGGAVVGMRLLPTATGLLGPFVGALVGFAGTMVLASEIGGHGRCPCGHWLREIDRVDGFAFSSRSDGGEPDDDLAWMTIWHCPRCQALLRRELARGSFV